MSGMPETPAMVYPLKAAKLTEIIKENLGLHESKGP